MKDNLTILIYIKNTYYSLAPKFYLNILAINVHEQLQNNAITALFSAITVKTGIHLDVHT